MPKKFPTAKLPKEIKDTYGVLLAVGTLNSKELAAELGLKYGTVRAWMTKHRRALAELSEIEKGARVDIAKGRYSLLKARIKENQALKSAKLQKIAAKKADATKKTPEPASDSTHDAEIVQENAIKQEVIEPEVIVDSETQNAIQVAEVAQKATPAAFTAAKGKMEGLTAYGLDSIEAELLELQSATVGKLRVEIYAIDALLERIHGLIAVVTKPSEVNYLARALDQAIRMRRNVLLLPMGAIDPNKAIEKAPESQHVHFHGAGLPGFTPK